MSHLPKILILGAGYAGILTAQNLQKIFNENEADITLVNKHDYHFFTTQLHMPAAGTQKEQDAQEFIHKLIDRTKINFVKGTVAKIEPDQKMVQLEGGTSLDYDYLVIALGGETETFGIPGLKEYALSIRSIDSATRIRKHIEKQFEENKGKEEGLTFVVGGAGFTGIEFLGELTDRLAEMRKVHNVAASQVKIYNVEAAPSVLPGFDPELVDYAKKVLEDKGVEFKIGIAIKECQEGKVILANGEEILTNTIIWTGGVRGNHLIEEAGIETMRGRVKVDEYMKIPEYDNVFILGDNALVFNGERPFPPTAQISMQQGVNCAYNLAAILRNQPLQKFSFHNKGTVASLGKGQAVGMVGKTKLKGFTAAQLKKVIDNRYLFIIGGVSLVVRKGRFFS